MTQAEHILQSVFGHAQFRGEQGAVIEHVAAGGDALVVMPTGGGKSLCYQVPALLRDGVAVVVSPLIALMQDQVRALQALGVRAACLHSGLEPEALRDVEARVRAGELDLLYAAPERVLTGRFQNLVARARVALFAIDEAHCVTHWGHEFRPEYQRLGLLARRFPDVPRIALTATADAKTRTAIVAALELRGERVFVGGFDRPNIHYRIEPKRDARRQLLDFLDGHRGEAGIVYAFSRKRVETVAEWLREAGWDALAYHAGLPDHVRRARQQRFVERPGVVVVATVAFGMGIDKPDVRFVAHLDAPRNLEAYYQETGRAGRDGLPAEAWMVYGLEDAVRLRRLLTDSPAPEEHKRAERRRLDLMLGFCELATCRRQALLRYFGETTAEPCGHCDNCQSPLPAWDGTEAAQKALSCVYRTGQRYGVRHLVDVLLGKPTAMVRRLRHDRVSTYGIGRELGPEQWRTVFRQLVAHGFLDVMAEGMGTLRLTEACRAVLRGERRLWLRRPEAGPGRHRRGPVAPAAPPPPDVPTAAVDWTEDVLALYRIGFDVADITQRYGLSADAVYRCLARAVGEGRLDVQSAVGLSVEELERIRALERDLDAGPDRVRAVYDALGGRYELGVLRCVLAAG